MINVNSVSIIRQTDAHSGGLHIDAHALAPLMTKKEEKKQKTAVAKSSSSNILPKNEKKSKNKKHEKNYYPFRRDFG